MNDLRIDIVTFNANEERAVEQFLDDLLQAWSAWSRAGRRGIKLKGKNNVELNHMALNAQGNVVAAAQLAMAFADIEKRPDFVIFYGCAGAVDPAYVGEAFLIGSVSYASLGTVEPSGRAQGETVTLKSKWLCNTRNSGASPLESIDFSEALSKGALNLQSATSLTTAHVVATDKVIRVAASLAPPRPLAGTPVHYASGPWTYGDALAYVTQCYRASPVLVEMESFGIGKIAHALSFDDHVVIVRVVTDDLVGHRLSKQAQGDLLMAWRGILARLVLAMVVL